MNKQLTNFLPKGSVPLIEQWVYNYSVEIIISKPRKTKWGDYRYFPKFGKHQISVNKNLTSELFLLTLTHEIAHMHTFTKYGRKIKPHGKDWKSIFKNLILQTFSYYSLAVQKKLAQYTKNPKATLSSHPNLLKELKGRREEEHFYYLDELNDGSLFIINQKILKKGILKRTRYLCEEYQSERKYLVNRAVQVEKYEI
ncbi:MAG: SprT-like domain-containing protein [Flavobacteriales bacterium]